ncbi:MAG: hypothetical protein U0K81_06255 [Paludibacteraceae bacterium]|nr:hypothetical protein [Paludibacteraceae bacterium]
MKHYTTPEQTAKLIELGFEKPRGLADAEPSSGKWVREAYSIGELLEMLPETICTSHDDSCHYHLSMDTDACMWRVRYMDDFDVTLSATYDDELINALYDMVIVLKRRE